MKLNRNSLACSLLLGAVGSFFIQTSTGAAPVNHHNATVKCVARSYVLTISNTQGYNEYIQWTTDEGRTGMVVLTSFEDSEDVILPASTKSVTTKDVSDSSPPIVNQMPLNCVATSTTSSSTTIQRTTVPTVVTTIAQPPTTTVPTYASTSIVVTSIRQPPPVVVTEPTLSDTPLDQLPVTGLDPLAILRISSVATLTGLALWLISILSKTNHK